MSDPLLQINGVSKSFGAINAVNNVDLSVVENTIHAVIGPNGAGKTTLLSVLSGELEASNGSIQFDGQNVTRFGFAKRAKCGLARSFQITSIILPMTLQENVALAVQSRLGHSFHFWSPVTQDREIMDRALQTLELVGLQNRAQQPAAEVSHGEQRQLEIAMALALDPKCLLLDEPMAGMGIEESASLVTLLKKLKQDKTLLLIEHDMDAVFSLADTISVLVNGEIIASGDADYIRGNNDVQRAYLGGDDQHA